MAWGISGDVGEIYRKQQSDELRDQLLKQEMAQRIRAFEAEQIYRQQQMAAQAEERRALQEERQADRADRLTQRQRQGAMDTIAISGPGPTTEAVAGPISAYAPTASLITRRNVLPSTALGGMSQEDTSGPQNFPVREPTPPELESTRERVRRGELTRVISGVNRADPNWRAKLAAQFADVDPKGALSQVLEPTEAERVAARRGDLEDAARIGAKYREPQRPQYMEVPDVDEKGNAITRVMTAEQAAGRTFARTVPKKPATGTQNRTLQFFNSAKQADEDMEKVEQTIANLNIGGQVRLNAPNWANFLQSQEGQLYNQSQRAFAEAYLRRASGAQIRPDEFATIQQTYFTVPGDTPKTIAQKRRGRAAVLAGLANESGPALHDFYGEEAPQVINTFKTRSTGEPTATPDLTGLKPGTGRRFNEGPFKGQQWTVGPDGKPKRVE